ncbi:MAG: DUF4920 domain-containing protein [Rhodothermaceae bacterium]|nr:DUF4920 domain-containing protein [Rhodothermaceae bacterium]
MRHFKTLFAAFFIFGTLISCSNEAAPSDEWETFGDEITPAGSVSVGDVIDEFELDVEKEFKITGTLVSVCQEKGCWTTLETDDGRDIRMTFKDYSFFLPIDYAGKTVVAEGIGFKKVTGVDELRHFAEDGGKSAEDIEAITEPKTEYLFEARGVLAR